MKNTEKTNSLIISENIEEMIFVIRGVKVMLDTDLSKLYGVPTKALNQAVKRNIDRFPGDFMFLLSDGERSELVTKCDRFTKLKHSSSNPYAFTEHGVAMLSSILNSKNAIQVNIIIMRTFSKIRNIISTHKELSQKLQLLEHKVGRIDDDIITIFSAIRRLMKEEEKPKKKFGFV